MTPSDPALPVTVKPWAQAGVPSGPSLAANALFASALLATAGRLPRVTELFLPAAPATSTLFETSVATPSTFWVPVVSEFFCAHWLGPFVGVPDSQEVTPPP